MVDRVNGSAWDILEEATSEGGFRRTQTCMEKHETTGKTQFFLTVEYLLCVSFAENKKDSSTVHR